MNEKAKTLLDTAYSIFQKDTRNLTMSDIFAELIVRECAKIADIADENKCEWIGGNILTHFGVEE